jgi:TolB-like protein/Tfp pilus assembly protein PilF
MRISTSEVCKLTDLSGQEQSVLDALEAVLASDSFLGADRQKRFLRFIVEKALHGEADNLKEYVLALEVFDRPPSFNPREDSIVRVEARKLRERLTKYYATSGELAPIRISLPKGGYVPDFELRAEVKTRTNQLSVHRVREYAVAGSVALLLLATALVFWYRSSLIARKEQPVTHSLAVMPFGHLGGEPADGYFADGLTEELIHGLSAVEGLRVVARSSVLGYKSKAHDFKEIAQNLRVTEVLEGSVRKADNTRRVTVQLISVPSGFQLWSKEYDSAVGNETAVQETIARAVLYTLKHQSPNLDELKLAARGVQGPAHDLYLHGLYAHDRATRVGLERSIADLQKALLIDNSYAPAYAAIASSYAALTIYGFWPPGEAVPRAKEAAQRAITLDPRLAEPQAVLGFAAAVFDWNWQESERRFQKSIDLNPGCATCRAWYGFYCLSPTGRSAEAEQQIDRAVDLDPLSWNFQSFRIAIPFYAAQHDVAIERAKHVLSFSEQFFVGHLFLASALRQKGRLPEALQSARRAAELSGNNPMALRVLADVYASMGDKAEVGAILKRLMDSSRQHHVSPSVFFCVYGALGDSEEALAWLEKAVDAHDPYLIYMRSWPVPLSVQRDARYGTVVRKLGLPEPAINTETSPKHLAPKML